MESPGKYLKAERESRNIPLKKISESTKIRESILRAIEEDQYDLLSSPVYVKGFLDAYARYLGLDTTDLALRYQNFQDEKGGAKGPEVKQRIRSSKKRVSLWFSMVFIAAIILLLGILVYFYFHNPVNYFVPSSPSSPPLQKEGGKDQRSIMNVCQKKTSIDFKG